MAQPDVSREPFEKFLLWLSSDRDLALKRHDEIMQRIRKYFVRKGCPDSEDLAAETRERVIKIINAGRDYPNPVALFCSVANKVRQESRRKPMPEALPNDDRLPLPRRATDEKEAQAYCLEKCLAQLPVAERDLIMRYYQGRGVENSAARKLLIAEQAGESTLRVKAFRIRTKLRVCMKTCLSECENCPEMIRGTEP